ncbi:MAG: PIG-L family deacetylase [Candidatus Beckwithbacteria bacterium]|nr:PIG-L family deacetylase [Candidatus Beckwithbacteria bacterium]
MSSFFRWLKKINHRHRRLIIIVFIIWGFWFFGFGALLSFFLSKGQLARFPDLTNHDRILILAPHVDDEVISSAGIINHALKTGAAIKIVYLTNGDNSLSAVIKENRNLKLSPNEFVSLGEQRMSEAKAATAVLGLTADNLIFLGYPDQGLTPMFNKYYDPSNPYASKGTEFTYNPYSGTYKSGQLYTGTNVVNDLNEIIQSFNPTVIIAPHPRDIHPDHHAAYLFLEKVLNENSLRPQIFTYLVHYPRFPVDKKLASNQFLYPPKKLYTQEGWYSYDLSPDQITIKLEAVKQNVSQKEFGRVYDLLQSFVKKNEIFEKM